MFSQLGATGEVIALGLTLFAHILGGFALIYTLVRDSGENVRDWWPGDDDGGSPRSPEPPTPGDGGGDLPLPGAEPSATRARRAGRPTCLSASPRARDSRTEPFPTLASLSR
jgi:hypothetical protein